MPNAERCAGFSEYRDKALELLANRGFALVGMRELAAGIGLSVGSLYHHYPSKQHLLLDLIGEFYEERLAVLARVAKQGLRKRETLPALIQAHQHLHQHMPWHFRLAERDIECLSDEQRESLKPFEVRYERDLFLMLRPSTSPLEPQALADAAIMARLLNSAPIWVGQHELDTQQRDQLLLRLVAGAIDRILDRTTQAA